MRILFIKYELFTYINDYEKYINEPSRAHNYMQNSISSDHLHNTSGLSSRNAHKIKAD